MLRSSGQTYTFDQMKPKKKKRNKNKKTYSADENSILENAEYLISVGKFHEAIDQFKKIPANSPRFGRACKGHGAALLRIRKLAEALPVLQSAHLAIPEDADILVDGADVARLMGGLDVAEETYAEARKLGAAGYQILFGEASIVLERKLWIEAVRRWELMNETYPDNPFVIHNLGRSWHELGETDIAVSFMKRSLELSDDLITLSTLGLLAPHAGCLDHEEVRCLRIELCARLSEQEGSPVDSDRPVKTTDKLNIGYVSAFFHRRNWMKPVWALLNHHDREKIRVHLFADGPPEEIAGSGGYISDKQDRIYDTRDLSNRKLAELISECEIDVLVDLNSYSAIKRLGLWTAKPAPVTVGWFNLYATSGMKGIEWLIGDDVVIDPDEERFYTEKIVRLKQSYLTFQVGYDTPDIETPGRDQPFTYGCLGSGYKITPEVRAAWIKLLKETDRTRLLVRNRILGEETQKQWFLDFFRREGIGPERLVLLGPSEHKEFLKTYSEIDLALDTFPYSGGTTTMESLWQGVPMVCFRGDRWVSRTSATLMRSAMLGEFIGSDVDEYVEIAARWGTPEYRERLRKLRTSMREHLENSEVCDGSGLARDFERIIFEISK